MKSPLISNVCRGLAALAAGALLASGLTAPAAAPRYHIQEMPTLGGNHSRALGINGRGHVVGEAQTPAGVNRAVLWHNGTLTDLGTLGGDRAQAYAINNAGFITGRARNAGGRDRPFLYDPATQTMTELPTAGGQSASNVDDGTGFGINDAKVVGGHSRNAAGQLEAFFWQNGVTTGVGTPGGAHGRAWDINESGQLAGWGLEAGGATVAYRWSPGTGFDLIPALQAGDEMFGIGINDLGHVVGSATATGRSRAWLWDGSTLTDLGQAPGFTGAGANRVNNHGQVAGLSYRFNAQNQRIDNTATVWIGGQAVNLNEAVVNGSGWHLESAYHMNDAGQIVGWGRKNGNTRGFLLTPLPGKLYAIGGFDPDDTGMVPHRIYELDPVTGKATPLPGSFKPEPAGLAATADGRLLALNVEHHHHHGEEPPPAEAALVEIDPFKGFITKLATVPVEAYGFDILPDGRAFTIPMSTGGTPVQLHAVNLETGAATPVGSASAIDDAFAAAFGSAPAANKRATQLASVGGHLYAIVRQGTNANLVRFDPDTGAATVFGAADTVNAANGGAYRGIPGLSGRDSNGDGVFDELYGVLNYHDHDGDPETRFRVIGALIKFDLNDGTWSIVGTNPGLLFSGLASTAALNPTPRSRYLAKVIALDGANYVAGEEINESGVVAVGAYDADDKPVAARFDSALRLLAPLTSRGAYANSINDAGLAVGWALDGGGLRRPVAWSNGIPVDLGTLGGDRGEARGVNQEGKVVGQARNAGTDARAFLWTETAGMTELPMTLGGNCSAASAINRTGLVAGNGRRPDEKTHAVRFDPGTSALVDLGTLGGDDSFANGINDAGHVVGLSDAADNTFRPFFWSPQTGMLDLFGAGHLGSPNGAAYDLNAAGEVVGYGNINEDYDSHAFLWTRSAGLVDLNQRILGPPGLVLAGASGINDAGQITGWGSLNGQRVAFVLTPVIALDHGELDIGLVFHDGELEFHLHDEASGVEHDAARVVLAAGSAAEQPIPDTVGFQFLGRPGHSVWILPAVENKDLLYLGLAAEEVESGVFVNNALRVELVSVEGAGDFFLYTTDPFGAPQVHMNSADGISAADFFLVTAGGHTDLNWAFTAPGTYRIGLRARGTRVEGNEAVASDVFHFTFHIPAAHLPQPQEPDDSFVYKVDLIEVTDAGYIAGEELNELGEVAVGAYDAGDRPMAGRFLEAYTPLAPLTSAGAYANGINDAGVVVGWGLDDAGLRRPLMWSNGLATDLGTLGGDRGEARAVNRDGRVVGQARNAAAEPRAFQWTSVGGMTELPMTLGGNRSSASAINDADLVAGSGSLPDGRTHAVRHDPVSGTTLDLGTLGGANSFANGINAAGHVVGLSDASDGTFRPFYWSPETGMTDLFAGGDLGVPFGAAYDINAAGEVVGYGEINDDFDSHAFVWSAGAGLRDLNKLVVRMSGLELHGAAGINDAGQITG